MDNNDRPKINGNLEIVIYSKDEQHRHRTYYYSVKELTEYITEEVSCQLENLRDDNEILQEYNESLLKELKSFADVIDKIKTIINGDK